MSRPDNNYPPGDFSGRSAETFGADLNLDPPLGGEGYDDIFKVSNCTGCKWGRVVVNAGRQLENALDLNRESCWNRFEELIADAGGQGAVLVKGGSSHNRWERVLIRKAGGHTDIMIGGYSGQSKKTSRANHFERVERADGKPVRVAWTFLRAERPTFGPNCKVEYQYFWSLVRTIAQEWSYLTA